MVSRFGEGENLLVSYIENYRYREGNVWIDHPDPTLGRTQTGQVEFSYCTGNIDLVKCGKGNYVFFHTSTGPRSERVRFITAYLTVKDIGPSREICRRYSILGAASHSCNWDNHYILLGDEHESRRIREPGLRFDRTLAEQLQFRPPKRIRFEIIGIDGRRRSDLECIASATRSIRVLTDRDVELLMRQVR